MSRMRGTYDVAAFIKAYTEAVEAGLTLPEIATLLGLSAARVSQRARALAKRGIPLPKRKHALAGKPGHPCSFKGQARPGPRAKPKRCRRAVERTEFCKPELAAHSVKVTPGFVITVSAF